MIYTYLLGKKLTRIFITNIILKRSRKTKYNEYQRYTEVRPNSTTKHVLVKKAKRTINRNPELLVTNKTTNHKLRS
jgi:hypothetical protein